uniref:Autophagy-related protein 11 n=1 Tax=Lygus hesperus TaxID=30085 RepID=A0A0A9XNA4_LYGHE
MRLWAAVFCDYMQLNVTKHQRYEERELSSKVTEELRKRVKQLEAELAEAMEIKNDLVTKFNTLFRKKKSAKMKREQLIQDVEDLSHEVEVQKDIISQLKKALNTCKSDMEHECEKSYQEGYKYGRHVATLEELGVLEQFKILKEMENTLETDIRKENHKRCTAIK